MKTFKQFNEEKEKMVTFAFGRFSPPHSGHLKLIDKVKASSGSGDYEIYASKVQDSKKNPLNYKDKIKFMKKMFSKHSKQIIFNDKVVDASDVLVDLYNRGYTKVNFVVGSDRIKSFGFLIKYNGKETKKGFYDFPGGIHILSAGDRDPDSDDIVSAMSASRLRKAAVEGDINSFELGMPKGFKDTKDLFNAVRSGLNLKAIKNFREHIMLDPVSDKRELYAKGEIFQKGDEAIIEASGEFITIAKCKSNFIVDLADQKYFIEALELPKV